MDVMDGNWVINRTITFGPALIRSVRDRLGPEVTIDCHLMITNAAETWSQYTDAGVDMVIAHIEAVDDFQGLIDDLHASGVRAGCVLNPSTPADEVLPLLPDLDLVLGLCITATNRALLEAGADGLRAGGAALATSVPAVANSVSVEVAWLTGSKALAALAGTPVRLVLRMQACKLFSLAFAE
mgnify:CR=1 FL=1